VAADRDIVLAAQKHSTVVANGSERLNKLRNIPEISASPILILRKKQLSHKELKTAKLKNDRAARGE